MTHFLKKFFFFFSISLMLFNYISMVFIYNSNHDKKKIEINNNNNNNDKFLYRQDKDKNNYMMEIDKELLELQKRINKQMEFYNNSNIIKDDEGKQQKILISKKEKEENASNGYDKQPDNKRLLVNDNDNNNNNNDNYHYNIFFKHIRKAAGSSIRFYLFKKLGIRNCYQEILNSRKNFDQLSFFNCSSQSTFDESNTFANENLDAVYRKNQNNSNYKVEKKTTTSYTYYEQEYGAIWDKCMSHKPHLDYSDGKKGIIDRTLFVTAIRHPLDRIWSEFLYSGPGCWLEFCPLEYNGGCYTLDMMKEYMNHSDIDKENFIFTSGFENNPAISYHMKSIRNSFKQYGKESKEWMYLVMRRNRCGNHWIDYDKKFFSSRLRKEEEINKDLNLNNNNINNINENDINGAFLQWRIDSRKYFLSLRKKDIDIRDKWYIPHILNIQFGSGICAKNQYTKGPPKFDNMPCAQGTAFKGGCTFEYENTLNGISNATLQVSISILDKFDIILDSKMLSNSNLVDNIFSSKIFKVLPPNTSIHQNNSKTDDEIEFHNQGMVKAASHSTYKVLNETVLHILQEDNIWDMKLYDYVTTNLMKH